MTDDGAKKETVMVTPTAPLITVAGDAGMTHSYPQRTFKPEEPKTTETVTPKRISQSPSPQFISFHQCPTFQNMSTDTLSKIHEVVSFFNNPLVGKLLQSCMISYDIVNFLESKTSVLIEALVDSFGCHCVWNQRRRPHGKVTLKTGGETGGAVDHTLIACVSLAVMGSVALVTVGKSSPLFFFAQGVRASWMSEAPRILSNALQSHQSSKLTT